MKNDIDKKTVIQMVVFTLIAVVVITIAMMLMGCQVAMNERSITQTPKVYQPATNTQPAIETGPTASPWEKTWLFSLLHWGPSPSQAISTIGTMEAPKSGEAGISGFRSIKDASRGPVILIFMGGIAVLVGCVVGWKINRNTGIAVAVGGGTLLAVGLLMEAYPWVILAVPILCIAAGVWFFFGTKRGKELREKYGLTDKALRETVNGVQVFKAKHPDQKEEVNTLLLTKQDKTTSKIVDEIKVESK